MSIRRLTDLTNAVLAVCPIDGISLSSYDSVAVTATVVVQFKAAATPAQRTAAASVVAGFNWHDQVPKLIPALRTEYAALSAADKQKLLELVLAHVLTQRPALAADFGVLGIGGTVPDTV